MKLVNRTKFSKQKREQKILAKEEEEKQEKKTDGTKRNWMK